jgi:hypothetical protein
MKIKATLTLIIYVLLVAAEICLSQVSQDMVLWYRQPAEHFEEALVLGNGRTGATVFGGIQSDRIYLNDATLWSGGPVDPNANPDVSSLIPQVREALAKEDYRTAERLNRKIEGKFSESYKANSRMAFSGKCLVIVQTTKTPGSIMVTADSNGLSTASVTIHSIAGKPTPTLYRVND